MAALITQRGSFVFCKCSKTLLGIDGRSGPAQPNGTESPMNTTLGQSGLVVCAPRRKPYASVEIPYPSYFGSEKLGMFVKWRASATSRLNDRTRKSSVPFDHTNCPYRTRYKNCAVTSTDKR